MNGFIRDISVSSELQANENDGKGPHPYSRRIERSKQILFLFDTPISKSGELAEEVRRRLNEACLPGDAQAVKVPEHIPDRIFPVSVATSDHRLSSTPRRRRSNWQVIF